MEIILFFVIIIAVFVSIISGIFIRNRLAQWKGAIGEKVVAHKLSHLDKNKYKILHNVFLPSTHSGYSQIDHVIVSCFGIFCIETKAYTGIISGNANEKEWLQTIYQKKNTIYNPLWQNYSHVKTLETMISDGYPKANIIPIVVFTKTKRVYVQGSSSLCFVEDLLQKINNYNTETVTVSECDEIYERISRAHIHDKKLWESHVQRIRQLNRQ